MRPRVMAVLQNSDVMCLSVFLLCAGLHFTTGCTEEFSYVSCSPGESVLLRCRDENSRDKHIQWWNSDFEEPRNSVDVIKDQRYKDRVQIHRNLSLSITPLTVDDSGSYWCNSAKRVYLIVEGCSISGNETSVAISRYSGESVFLSCSVECSARYNPDAFRWKLPNYREINQMTNSAEPSRLYQGRFHMFDIQSGNVSLLISNLTEKDEGLYVCRINENQHKSFSLTVKGCTLSETEREPKTKYPGDSVLLSCSCKDPKTKPVGFKWTRLDSNGTEVSNETLGNRNRVHTFHKTMPSNLSLLISNLTEDDQGTYRCTVNNKTSTYTTLTVKGCVLSEHHITKISHAGESVTLPCSCEDPKTKPKHVEWKRSALNESLVSDAADVNARFQILRDPPHNLSLRISNLTEADGGLYVCTVNGKQSRRINLSVTDFSINPLTYSLMFLICLMLLLVTGFIYWRFTRAKKGRRGSRVTQSPDHQDDVTYSTVMQINRRKPAENQQQDDVTYSSVIKIKGGKRTCRKEEVVYSTMADVRNGRSAQDDVTYSSVVSKSHTPRPLQMNTEEATVYASVQKDKK